MTPCPNLSPARKLPDTLLVLALVAVFVQLVFQIGAENSAMAQTGGGSQPIETGKGGGSQRGKAAGKIMIGRDASRLPAPVAQMREAILEAVRRGDIDELKYAIDMNELKPDFGAIAADDPIDGLKKASADGKGLEILAVLGELLEGPYAVVHAGPDIENNRLFVWPYLAELPPGKFTPAQEVEIYRLMGHKDAAAVRGAKSWSWWRLAIGADGVWHSFTRSGASSGN